MAEAREAPAAREIDAPLRPARIGSPANLLGLARILATPIIIGLVLLGQPGFGIAAFALYVVAALTDFVDGWVARSRGEVSALGVFMDLTADKVLVAGVLIVLVEVDLLPTWIVATILVRELVVAGVRQVAAAEEVIISARALGKAKTMATNAGIALLLLAHDAATGGPLASTDAGAVLLALGFWTMVAATILTVLSGAGYLRGALPLLRGTPPRG